MNQYEIDLIKDKIFKSKVFLFFFLIFILVWLILWFNYEFSLLTKIIGSVLTLMCLIFVIASFKQWNNSVIDLKKNIKISETLKITNKYIDHGIKRSNRYYIILESNEIKKYQLKQNIYDIIHINDFIYVEYSKFANWILKIEHKGKSIENKNVIT